MVHYLVALSIWKHCFSVQRATFRINLKVRTKASIFLLEGHEYEFMCNTKAPYKMVIKTDDNTRFFADRCSYSFKKLSNKEIKKRLNGKMPTSQVPGELISSGVVTFNLVHINVPPILTLWG